MIQEDDWSRTETDFQPKPRIGCTTGWCGERDCPDCGPDTNQTENENDTTTDT